MRMIKKIMACFITASLVFGGISVHASNPSARNISIFRVDGDNVTLSRGDARTTTPRDGQRLSSGNILATGLNSSVHIQMDTASILQMSASSQVAVSQTGNNLVLSVQSGAALVEVRDQSSGNTTETRVGNVGLTVRGTMYTMGLRDDYVSIVMLSGYGDVEGEPLYSGQIMHVFDDFRPGTNLLYYETAYFRLINLGADTLGVLDLFTLEVMYEHREYLIEVGTLTPEMLAALPELIHGKQIEAEEALIAESLPEPPTVIIPLPEPNEENNDNGDEQPPIVQPPITPPDTGNGPNGYTPLLPGTGTDYDPYRIRNLEDMVYHFATPCNYGWAGQYFELHTDITNWTTVIGGFPLTPFEGSFDGRGNLITVNIDSADTAQVGLFAAVEGNVENLRVTGTVRGTGWHFVGGVAGTLNGTMSNVRAENLSVQSTFNPAFVGGIVGVVESGGDVYRAFTSATVSVNPAGGMMDRRAGGVAGQIDSGGTVRYVTVDAPTQVLNAEHMGAVAGYHMGLIGGVIDIHPDILLPTVGGGDGIVQTLAGFALAFLLLEEEDEEEYYCEDYPAKEEDEDDDYPAKENDEDDDYPAKNEDDDEEQGYDEEEEDDLDYEPYDDYEEEYPEEAYDKDDEDDYDYKDEDYVPTFPEDDFELKGYYA